MKQLIKQFLQKIKIYDGIEKCRSKFKDDSTKKFCLRSEYNPKEKGDLVLSLDVIYHLVEDEVFHQYMNTLFGASTRYVVIYSSNFDSGRVNLHMRHRKFTDFIESNMPQWKLLEFRKNHFPYREIIERDHILTFMSLK